MLRLPLMIPDAFGCRYSAPVGRGYALRLPLMVPVMFGLYVGA